MKEIQCYKYNTQTGKVELVGLVDDYESFIFSRSYAGVGEFSITISGFSNNIKRIEASDIIQIDNRCAGILTEKEDNRDDGVFNITYKGVELKGLAQKRIVMPEKGKTKVSFTKTKPETVIQYLLNTQILNPTDISRTIKGTLHTDGIEYNDGTIDYEGMYSNVAEDIELLCATYNVGWYAVIEGGEIHWYIFHGKDRCYNQSENDRWIISYENDNLDGATFTIVKHSPDTAFVAGKGEGKKRKTATYTQADNGWERTEIFVECRDIDKAAELQKKGREEIANYGSTEKFEATPAKNMRTKYRLEYDLGDIGTLVYDGAKIEFQLTEIDEVYENNVYTLNYKFGYDNDNLAAALARIQRNNNAIIHTETGIFAAEGETLISSGFYFGFCTSGRKTIYLSIPVTQSLQGATTVTCKSLKGNIANAGGYAITDSYTTGGRDFTSYITDCNLCYDNNSVIIKLEKSSEFTLTNNTTVILRDPHIILEVN